MCVYVCAMCMCVSIWIFFFRSVRGVVGVVNILSLNKMVKVPPLTPVLPSAVTSKNQFHTRYTQSCARALAHLLFYVLLPHRIMWVCVLLNALNKIIIILRRHKTALVSITLTNYLQLDHKKNPYQDMTLYYAPCTHKWA